MWIKKENINASQTQIKIQWQPTGIWLFEKKEKKLTDAGGDVVREFSIVKQYYTTVRLA